VRDVPPDESAARALYIGAAVALVAFCIVVQQVMANGWLVTVDRNLAQRAAHDDFFEVIIGQHAQRGGLVHASRAITPLGNVVVLLVISLVAATVLWSRDRQRAAVFVPGALVSGALLDIVLRTIIGDARPALPDPWRYISHFGLPSGHALDVTVCFTALLIVAWTTLAPVWRGVATVAVAAVVAAVAASRVVILVHYLSDVLGGVALGLAWVLFLAAVFRPWQERTV